MVILDNNKYLTFSESTVSEGSALLLLFDSIRMDPYYLSTQDLSDYPFLRECRELPIPMVLKYLDLQLRCNEEENEKLKLKIKLMEKELEANIDRMEPINTEWKEEKRQLKKENKKLKSETEQLSRKLKEYTDWFATPAYRAGETGDLSLFVVEDEKKKRRR